MEREVARRSNFGAVGASDCSIGEAADRQSLRL